MKLILSLFRVFKLSCFRDYFILFGSSISGEHSLLTVPKKHCYSGRV